MKDLKKLLISTFPIQMQEGQLPYSMIWEHSSCRASLARAIRECIVNFIHLDEVFQEKGNPNTNYIMKIFQPTLHFIGDTVRDILKKFGIIGIKKIQFDRWIADKLRNQIDQHRMMVYLNLTTHFR
jgi:hypothetical protein